MEDNTSNWKLTLEQSFNLRAYEDMLNNATPEQLRELLLDAMKMLMVKDNIIRDMAKQNLTYGRPLL